MPERAVTCPWCEVKISLEPGNWSYERSQVVLHLARCQKRPAKATTADVNEAADRLAEAPGNY